MKRVVFFLSLLIVVFCSSCEKEEIPLEQKIVGEWNLDRMEINVLKDDVFVSQSTPRFRPTIYSFTNDKKLSVIDAEDGFTNYATEWLTITEDAIVFKESYFYPNVNKCVVEKITATSCTLVFIQEVTWNASANENDTYVHKEIRRITLSK